MRLIGLIGLMGLMGLMGCSEDSEDAGRVTIEVQPCATGFAEEGDLSRMGDTGPWGITRAWTPPTSPTKYVTYNEIYGTNGMFANQKNLVHKSISAFFTKDGETPIEATFFYLNSSINPKWQMRTEDVESLPAGDYFLYGFIPKEDATGIDIRANESYSNGAVLTIHGLNTVTPSDVCVIVGAKDDGNWETSYDSDNDSHTVIGLQAGHFGVHFNSGESATNYIFLLFDHIYSALRFGFKIDEEYAALRTIRLRKLELTAYSDDHGGAVKAKYNATITLRKNDSGTSPIVGSVVFEADDTSADVAPTPLFDWENDPNKYVTLTTDAPTQFMGCFVPGDHTYFKLRTTYDVFDKNVTTLHPEGNLIRQECQAENTINLESKFSSYMETVRGHCYTYTVTVKPTYLYVLSEPDLDNPTITIDN